MKPKKYLLLPASITIGLSTFSIISCSSSSTDYKVMNFVIDDNKVKALSSNPTSFNAEPITKEKLLKIVKNTLESLDKYTLEALGYSSNDNYTNQQISACVFDKIAIENNELIINIKNEIIVDINGKKVEKQSLYRLPNNSTQYRVKI